MRPGNSGLTVPRGDSRSVRLVIGDELVSLKQDVRPNVTLRVRSPRGEKLVFTGRVAIDRAGGPAADRGAGRPHLAGLGDDRDAQTTRNGRYAYTTPVSPRALGQTFYFRASTPAATLWQAASSTVRTVKVTR